MSIADFLALNVDMMIAILLSIVLGFLLGLEREITNKFAGLRTHMLVCIGSCVFTLLSIYAFPLAANPSNPAGFGDPARIAAQILTGIGFIGGGTVLRQGATVSGLTTAATLWVAAAIGMACGCEEYSLATVVTFLTVSVLVLIRIFEKEIIRKDLILKKQMKAIILCKNDDLHEIYETLNTKFEKIIELSKKKAQHIENYSKITIKAEVRASSAINKMSQLLNEIPNIDIIAIGEIYE